MKLVSVAFGVRVAIGSAQSPIRWKVPCPVVDQLDQGYPLLKNVESFEIYHASPATGVYSHHSQITYQRGTFFASWSNHRYGEDGSGQRVLCALSKDGGLWSKPFECFPSIDDIKDPRQAGRVLTAIAWVETGTTVYAIAEVDDKPAAPPPRSGSARKSAFKERQGRGRLGRAVAPTGELCPIFWLVDNPPKPVDRAKQFPSARDPRFREVASKITAVLAESLHMPAWDFQQRTTYTYGSDGHRLCEPSVYQRPCGELVKLSRDCYPDMSFRMYASVSSDGGQSWSPAERTNIPDSPSKSISGTLPDGHESTSSATR